MKACIYINCPDKYVGGSVWDSFCPRCGKPLYDVAHEKVKKLIEVGWYNSKPQTQAVLSEQSPNRNLSKSSDEDSSPSGR